MSVDNPAQQPNASAGTSASHGRLETYMQAFKFPFSQDRWAQMSVTGSKRIGGRPDKSHRPRSRYFHMPTAWRTAQGIRNATVREDSRVAMSRIRGARYRSDTNAAIPIANDRSSNDLNRVAIPVPMFTPKGIFYWKDSTQKGRSRALGRLGPSHCGKSSLAVHSRRADRP